MKADEAERRLNALQEFRIAYASVLAEVMTGTGIDGSSMSLGTSKPGRQREFDDAYQRVDLLSMKAARAFDAAGVALNHSPPGTHQYQAVNPALMWQISLERDTWFPPSMLNQLINRAIGRLEDLRDDPPPESARRGVFIPVPTWSSFSKVGRWAVAVGTGIVVTVSGGGILYLLGWLGN